MKRSFISLIMILGFMCSMVAMESTYVETTADRLVISSGNDKQGFITVQTSDGQNFTISKEIAKQIPTIKGLMEDIGESSPIPLPLVDGKEFDWIIQSLEMLNKNPNAQINTQELSVQQLIDLINASEYLDIKKLQIQLINKLENIVSSNTDLFFKVFFKLNKESQTLLWMRHPAYLYLTSVELHKELNNDGSSVVMISPDKSKLIVRLSGVGKIKIWDLKTESQPFEDLSHSRVYGIIISSDGSKLISFSPNDSKIKIWDLNTGMQLFETLSNDSLSEVLVNRDVSKLIAWSSTTGIIKVWDLNTRQFFKDLSHEGLSEVIISEDGRKMISWSHDGIIKIWDLNTGQLFKALSHEELAKQFSLSGVVISPDGRNMASYGSGKIKIWDLSTGQFIEDLQHEYVRKVIISQDGRKIISQSSDTAIKIWDLKTGMQIFKDKDSLVFNRFIISPDGSKLILWSNYPGKIKIWDLKNDMQPFEGLLHEGLSEVIISEDGRKMISWSRKNGTIKIWDLNTGQLLEDLQHSGVVGVVISEDGRNMISYGSDIIKVWGLSTGKLFEDLQDLKVDKVIISEDGSKLISWSSLNRTTKIWDFVERNEFDNLTLDQIKLILWLYENQNDENAKFSSELKKTYESLADNLKNTLSKKFKLLELVQPQVQQQPSFWQRWLPLFTTRRQWTAPN